MTSLNEYELKFVTGGCRLSRLVRIKDKTIKQAKKQLHKMYTRARIIQWREVI